MASIADVIKFTPTLGGLTDWILATAATGYRTPSGNLTNGSTYSYRAESADKSEWEVGTGAWTSATSTLARTTVLYSSTGAKVNFTVAPVVGIVALAADIPVTGTSGDTVPKNNTANIFSATQTVNKNASSFPSGLTSGALDVMAADATATLLNIVSFGANSNFTQSRAGGTAASMSAISSGDMIGQNVFKGYDGTEWGSNQVVIRSYATENWSSSARGSDLRFGTTSNGATTFTDRCRVDHDGTFRPAADNTYNLGNASWRWKEVFAGTGSINTSDARHKTDVRELSADEIAAAKALAKEIGAYQFLDSVAKKGSANARLHIGMTVQRAMQIMKNYGLEPTRYGFVCFDAWAHEKQEYEAVVDSEGNIVEPAYVYERQAGDLYGFRTDQFLMFIARGFEARLAALENPAAWSQSGT